MTVASINPGVASLTYLHPSCTHCLCFFHISRDAMQASLAGDISYHTMIAFGGRVGTLDAVGYVQLVSVSVFCLYVQFVSDSFLCCGAPLVLPSLITDQSG